MTGYGYRQCDEVKCAVKGSKVRQCKQIYVANDDDCIGDWTVGDQIGKGDYGVVYKACAGEDCRYVYKYIANIGKKALYNEAVTQHDAAQAGIAPKIIEVIEGDNDGAIIMESLKVTMWQYLQRPELTEDHIKETVAAGAKQIISLFNLDLCHNDPHLGNIMQAEDGSWLLIDFGQADELTLASAKKDINKFFHSYSKLQFIAKLPDMHDMQEEIIEMLVENLS